MNTSKSPRRVLRVAYEAACRAVPEHVGDETRDETEGRNGDAASLTNEAIRRVMVEAHERHPLRILAYCIPSNHWHLLVWPRDDGEVTAHFRWPAHTHAMRWRVAHRTIGHGRLYRGRFKSFPVQSDDHLLTVARHVERNALSAGLVDRAEDWPSSSLAARARAEDPTHDPRGLGRPRPAGWVGRVNAAMSSGELKRLSQCVSRGQPFGDEAWSDATSRLLGLEHTRGPEGRPPKQK